MKPFVIALALLPMAAQDATRSPDAEAARYVKRADVSGELSIVGSDTFGALLTRWSGSFSDLHPGVQFAIETKGSNAAPQALTQGLSHLAPMSREMKAREIDAFEEKHGYPPTALRVALDGIVLFVHKDNPIDALTLEQLDAIYSTGRNRGQKTEIRTWGQLGARGDWANRPITLYGRNSLSGTHTFFRENVLRGGEFRKDVQEQSGSDAVVAQVARDPSAIGYAGLAYPTAEVKKIALAERKGIDAVQAGKDTVADGSYPISRALYVYVNRAPGRSLHRGALEFSRYMLSREGQAEVEAAGFVALPGAVVLAELRKLE
jgi:phosphate transport system substrate-binding protein